MTVNSSNSSTIKHCLLDPLVRKLMIVIFSIGTVFGTGLRYGWLQVSTEVAIQPEKVVSDAEYERLQLGATLVEAQALLSRGIEISQSTGFSQYVWKNSDGSGIEATFEEGLLVEKKKIGSL